MKKIVKNLVGILGCSILLIGCVQIPQVPDSMKVSTYNNTSPTSTVSANNNHYTNVANLTGDEKLSCEYKYCTARLEDSSLNEVCKPSRDRMTNITNQYTKFSEQQKAIDSFIKLCPHKNIIDSPFN